MPTLRPSRFTVRLFTCWRLSCRQPLAFPISPIMGRFPARSPCARTAATPRIMTAIQINSVEKSYKAFKALKGVSLTIEQGEFFGLLGPNGAGKTTLISTIAGLIRPDVGSVSIHGHDVVTDFREARKKL